jgi:CBS domain-containing protein
VEFRKIGEIMIPLSAYPYLNHRAKIREAIDLFLHFQLETSSGKSLPRMILVFDDINQLVGTIRRRDILRGLEPSLFVKGASPSPMDKGKMLFKVAPDPNLKDFFFHEDAGKMLKNADLPVTKIIDPLVGWLNIDDTAEKAIYEMVAEDTSLLPVVDGGRAVGIVRTVDLLKEVDRMMKERGE